LIYRAFDAFEVMKRPLLESGHGLLFASDLGLGTVLLGTQMFQITFHGQVVLFEFFEK